MTVAVIGRRTVAADISQLMQQYDLVVGNILTTVIEYQANLNRVCWYQANNNLQIGKRQAEEVGEMETK